MTNPTGYWCPVHGDCQCYASIPVYTPLAVPEVTTWGESGGAEAVTASGTVGIMYDLGGRAARWIWSNDNCDGWDMAKQINYVAGAK